MKIRGAFTAFVISISAVIAAPAHASSTVIGIAYDIGGRGDRSFNDAAAVGLEKASKQFSFTVQPVVTDGTTTDRDHRVRSLIAKNCNPIIVVGAGYAPLIQALAVEFPNTQFAILNDASIDALNVTSLIFADTQGAYLAGFSAALASKSGKVAMADPAIKAPHSVSTGLCMLLSANGNVYISGERMTTKGPMKLFHEAMKVMSPRVPSAGCNKGSTMRA